MPADLGNGYDISLGAAPVDLSGAAVTGKRVNMQFLDSLDILVVKGAGTAADDPTFTLKSHTAASGGTSSDLATIAAYHVKAETTLDGDEPWVRVEQTAAATVADPGGAGTSAEEQQLLVIHVRPEDLPEGHAYVSVNVADVGTNAQLGAVVYITHPFDRAAPEDMRLPLR